MSDIELTEFFDLTKKVWNGFFIKGAQEVGSLWQEGRYISAATEVALGIPFGIGMLGISLVIGAVEAPAVIVSKVEDRWVANKSKRR